MKSFARSGRPFKPRLQRTRIARTRNATSPIAFAEWKISSHERAVDGCLAMTTV
jgi:hypothetical protein